MIHDIKSNEKDQIGERKANELDSEDSETDERYQIENTQSGKRIGNQQNRENDDLVYTEIDLDTDTIVEDTTEIIEPQPNNEGLENMVDQYTENTQLSPNESVARKFTESPVENVDTKKKWLFMT